MKYGWLFLLLVASCDPAGPTDPEPASRRITITNPLELVPPTRPRLAVVWAFEDGDAIALRSSADIEAPSPEGSVDVPLEMPPEDLLSKLTPRESLRLGSAALAIHRPRLVVYQDENMSEALEIEPDGTDRVIAVDGDEHGVAALLDVEAVLRTLPIEEIGSFYRLTGGRFSPFLSVIGTGSSLLAVDEIMPILVQLDDSGFPLDSLRCARPPVNAAGFESEFSVILDTGIDAAICETKDPPDTCASMALASLAPPSFLRSGLMTHYRDVVCNRNGGPLEALIIAERTISCLDCVCHQVYDTEVFVADQSSTPDWWPCGTAEARICLKGSSLIDYTLSCPE